MTHLHQEIAQSQCNEVTELATTIPYAQLKSVFFGRVVKGHNLSSEHIITDRQLGQPVHEAIPTMAYSMI